MTLKEFADLCDDGALSVDEQAKYLQKATAKAVLSELLASTPVDTGRARANWQTGSSNPASGIKYPKPEKPGSPDGAVQEAKDMFDDVMSSHYEGSIHITNNLEYIEPLNNGTSSQAPAGFIERAVAAAQAYIREKSRFNPFAPEVRTRWSVMNEWNY